MEKFADYPVVMLDIYGRERHPEVTRDENFIQESYSDRRARAELMLWTLNGMPGGSFADDRIILVDQENIPEVRNTTYSTVVTHLYGGRPQGGFIIDLNGKIIETQTWERPEQLDEVLSNIFGLEPGL